jgi:hypothetical protein
MEVLASRGACMRHSRCIAGVAVVVVAGGRVMASTPPPAHTTRQSRTSARQPRNTPAPRLPRTSKEVALGRSHPGVHQPLATCGGGAAAQGHVARVSYVPAVALLHIMSGPLECNRAAAHTWIH